MIDRSCRKQCLWFNTRLCPDKGRKDIRWCTLFHNKMTRDNTNGEVYYMFEPVKIRYERRIAKNRH